MAKKINPVRVIGRREFVDLPLLRILNTEAKIDTGAFSSAIHCEEIEVIKENGAIKGKFIIDVKQAHLNGKKLSLYLNQILKK
ncbi:MAG: ATP-dependent zinc protease [Sphingobacteriaceae bacterium]|nr:ATP-dependent zinc protease [Sphingobacteriaceae bacterium]